MQEWFLPNAHYVYILSLQFAKVELKEKHER